MGELEPSQTDILPGICDELPVPETAFIAQCVKWQALVRPLDPDRVPPREADEATLAALLVAVEYGVNLGPCAEREADRVLDLIKARESPWLDDMPWNLIKSLIGFEYPARDGMDRLSYNLNHHNSVIRGWIHEIAWIARKHLRVNIVRPILLGNLAIQLAGVPESAGILAALHEDKEELDRLADEFVPERLEDQYRERLIRIREEDWNAQPVNLWHLENKCRRIIWQSVANCRIRSEIGSNQ